MEVTVLDVQGFDPAIKGMRNPMNSWAKSDSFMCDECDSCMSCELDVQDCKGHGHYQVGKNDLALMQKLYKGGTEHRKFMRMIVAWMDVTASHVWWQEFDTYKIGTVRNSCSKMHKIHVKPFAMDDFATDGIREVGGLTQEVFNRYLVTLEDLRIQFNATQEKKYWKAMLEMLPMGFQITATIMINYEVAANILKQRHNHKWYEWHTFCDAIHRLPYFDEITGVK